MGSRCPWISLKYILIIATLQNVVYPTDIPNSNIFISSKIYPNLFEAEVTFSAEGGSTLLGSIELTMRH